MPPRSARPPAAVRRFARYNIAGSIDVTGLTETVHTLDQLVANAKHPDTINAAAQPVYDAEKRLFASNGEGFWTPHKEQPRAGRDPAPMRESGATYETLTRPKAEVTRGRKKYVIYSIRKRNTELRIGTKTPGAIMQKRGARHVPPRNALIVDETGRRAVVEAIRKRLLNI